jgi:1,2-beta-oligoglucan phosphorylase
MPTSTTGSRRRSAGRSCARGSVGVRGGWRLYSSGPGLFIHKVRTCLLGIRESFGEVVFDPVLAWNSTASRPQASLCGRPVRLRYQVTGGTFAPSSVSINGVEAAGGTREANPYREGGLCFGAESLRRLLSPGENTIIIRL